MTLSAARAALLERWLAAVVATPGLTALTDLADARRALLDDALAAVDLVASSPGSIIDVGTGGGTPGIPLAAAFPDRPVTLLDAHRRKCAFLEPWAGELQNAQVVWGRAESQPLERHDLAVAKALAQPSTAVEWCLPLVREGGAVLLWIGPTADLDALSRVASYVGGEREPAPRGFALIRKAQPTPPGFPRRDGAARKRPLS